MNLRVTTFYALALAGCLSVFSCRPTNNPDAPEIPEDPSEQVSEGKVQSVSLNKTTITLKVGESFQLEATITPMSAVDKTVRWASDDESVATVRAGLVKGISAGVTIVTITTNDGGKTASCEVTVIDNEVNPGTVAPESVTISRTAVTLYVGESISLSAAVKPDDATDKGIIWSSSKPNIASVDEDGKIVAISPGTSSVKAAAKGKTSVYAICEVTVLSNEDPNGDMVSITLVEEDHVVIHPDETYVIKYTVTPDTITEPDVVFTSSDENIFIVKSWNYTSVTIKGVSEGTAVLTGASAKNPSVKATCTVDVVVNTPDPQEETIEAIEFSSAVIYLYPGQNFDVPYQVSPPTIIQPVIEFSSSDEGIFKVLSANYSSVRIQGVAIGKATLMAKTLDGKVKATAQVIVTNNSGDIGDIGGGGGSGDIPPDPSEPTPDLPDEPNVPIPNPLPDVNPDEYHNYVVSLEFSGIQDPYTGEWISLYGTGLSMQNVWVEVDGTPKGIRVINLEDNTTMVKNDIIFAVDNSGSMSDEANAVARGIMSWSEYLVSKGLDVRFGVVGFGGSSGNDGITGALDMCNASTMSSYLNRSTGISRTNGFSGSNASTLQNEASKSTWKNSSGENGAQAVRFADEFFSFRPGASRTYIHFTDEPNHTGGRSDISVEYFRNQSNWPVGKGTIHSVISTTESDMISQIGGNSNKERPWLMATYTGGTIMYVKSDASNLNLQTLTVSDAITHSYTIRFIIPSSLMDGKPHTVRIIVIANGGSVRGQLVFTTVFGVA